MPHESSIRNWISSIKAEPGFLIDVFKEILKFPEALRHCNLVFDSAIWKQVLWDATSKKCVGLCDYGNGISIEHMENEATEVLVFMLVSLRGTWKWPVGYFFVNKITSAIQAELVKTALILSHQSDIRVWSVTCDGAHVNYSTMHLLGCNLYTTNYYELKSTFKHPSSDYDVHFVPDACHNIKLARNMLGDLKILKSPTAQINWNHVINLYKLQLKLNLKFANKLSSAHVNFRANIMKVKLAAQTLSSSTAAALEFLQFSEVENFQDCAGTIEFIKVIDEIFDFLNSRNPFGKGFKKPIFLNNIDFLQQRIEQKIEYLYTLVGPDNNKLCVGKRKTFILRFAAAVKSILQIAKHILIEPCFKYLMTYRFSQDHLELFFAQVRRRHGWNNNPNVLQFKAAMKSLLVKNSIRASLTANCTTFNAENDVQFKLTWAKKKNVQNWHDNIDSVDSIMYNDNVFDDDENEELYRSITVSENSFLKDNILYYIAGFVVKAIIRTLTCKGCIANIIRKVGEKQYNISAYTMLIDIKNKGGLVYASNDVYKIVCATETEFRQSLTEGQNKLTKDAYFKIIHRVKRRYVLHTDLFPNNDDCYEEFEIGVDTPHRLQLITIICQKYLTIRMYSHLNTLNKDVINPVSKRQKLSKLILFNNT